MEIVYKDPKELKPYKKNPRINDAAVGAVKASIEEFGFKVPIVIDGSGEIVCGLGGEGGASATHGRSTVRGCG